MTDLYNTALRLLNTLHVRTMNEALRILGGSHTAAYLYGHLLNVYRMKCESPYEKRILDRNRQWFRQPAKRLQNITMMGKEKLSAALKRCTNIGIVETEHRLGNCLWVRVRPDVLQDIISKGGAQLTCKQNDGEDEYYEDGEGENHNGEQETKHPEPSSRDLDRENRTRGQNTRDQTDKHTDRTLELGDLHNQISGNAHKLSGETDYKRAEVPKSLIVTECPNSMKGINEAPPGTGGAGYIPSSINHPTMRSLGRGERRSGQARPAQPEATTECRNNSEARATDSEETECRQSAARAATEPKQNGAPDKALPARQPILDNSTKRRPKKDPPTPPSGDMELAERLWEVFDKMEPRPAMEHSSTESRALEIRGLIDTLGADGVSRVSKMLRWFGKNYKAVEDYGHRNAVAVPAICNTAAFCKPGMFNWLERVRVMVDNEDSRGRGYGH